MTEVKITITAPELANAINNLAAALAGKTSLDNPDKSVQTEQNVMQYNSVAPVAPVSAPAQVTNMVTPPAPSPTPAAQTPANTVPTGAPQYTMDMLAVAGTALIDAGRMGELCGLLAKYGVESVTALNPAQYGAFATDLRALGAQI
ncbi:MAG TPA: hypothetical protein IAD22_05860 [Candidatus Limousia pullorum]|uniref:Uncharacterized protein n=1 Tax=Candidatus Limousia pullorum TaxID=2840860 RepID=A0A9D1LYV4_9FIRM|nr:hypothetical protein [Candidatus Limousia pullorum]